MTWGDDKAEKLSMGDVELTFLRFHIEMVIQEALENSTDMPFMLLERPWKD